MKDTFLMKINEWEQDEQEMNQNGFIVRTNVIKKGKEYLMHWHDYFEIEIMLSGRMEYIYNQNRHDAKRGNAYLMSYYDLHYLKALTDVELLNIRFDETLISKDLTDFIGNGANRLYCVFTKEEIGYIEELSKRVQNEFESDCLFSKEIIKNIISEIIVMIIRKSKTEGFFAKNSIIQKVTSKIKKDFRKDISLNSVAEEFSVSPNYLGSLFKKNTGISFSEYLNILRLKYACNLLKTSDYHIKEIALSSGYNSVEYFLYAFKKYMFITPGEFRKIR